MKKISFLLLSVVSLLSLTSCEEDRVTYDNENGTPIANFKTEGGLFTVDLSTVEQDVFYIDVEVSTISSVDRAISIETTYPTVSPANSSMFTIDPSSLKVPAGSYLAQIKVVANESDPLLTTTKKYVKFRLTGLEGGYITANKPIFDLAIKK